jgi:hypothetical protein
MENFFYEDDFCADFDDLALLININEDTVNELEDDWSIRVESTDIEPIFNVDANILCQLLAAANEDRLTEDPDEEENILKALTGAIDFGKLKDTLPKVYYPSNKFTIITKADLVEWFSHQKINNE